MNDSQMCDNCKNFSLAKNMENFTGNEQVIFFCPEANDYWISGVEVNCANFSPSKHEQFLGE